jgi:hypothetical protein
VEPLNLEKRTFFLSVVIQENEVRRKKKEGRRNNNKKTKNKKKKNFNLKRQRRWFIGQIKTSIVTIG